MALSESRTGAACTPGAAHDTSCCEWPETPAIVGGEAHSQRPVLGTSGTLCSRHTQHANLDGAEMRHLPCTTWTADLATGRSASALPQASVL